MPHVRKDASLFDSALRWLMQFALPVAAAVGLVAGVLWLSQLARDDLRRRGSHVIAFADLQCLPPDGMKRADFLDETRHLAGLPERLDALDATLPERVRSALALHPWVRKVGRVVISTDGLRAEMEYRVPVLWVESANRAADGEGVLLPVSASKEGLPVLAGSVKVPAGIPGQPWGDITVEAVSKLMGVLWPDRAALELMPCRITDLGGELMLRRGAQRILWGRPPGQEKPGELDAAAKVARWKTAKREGDVDLRK